MKTDPEFPQIGKKMTYQVPEGFFDHITRDTLDEARQRERHRRKSLFLGRTLAIAASLTILVTASYIVIEHMNRPEMTADPAPMSILPGRTGNSPEKPGGQDINEAVADSREITPVIPGKELSGNATFDELLASLSDDELIQLAAQYENDVFLEENDKQ